MVHRASYIPLVTLLVLFLTGFACREEPASEQSAAGIERKIADLVKALKSDDWEEWNAAAGELGNIGAPAIPQLMNALAKSEYSTCDFHYENALARVGGEATIPLILALQNPNQSMRVKAARVLGDIKDVRAIPALLNALWDSSADVRIGSARALADIGKPAERPLIQILDEPKSEVHSYAIYALGLMRSVEAVPILIRLLASRDESMRAEAAHALGNIGDERAIEPLIRSLQNADSSGEFGEALLRIGKSSVPALVAALQGTDENLRIRVVFTLWRLGDIRALPALLAASRDENPRVRAASISAMDNLDDIRAFNRIREGLSDSDGKVRLAALSSMGHFRTEEALATVREALRSPDVEMRRLASCMLVEELPDPKSAAFFIAALSDSDDIVRMNAVLGLKKLKNRAAVEPLINLLADSSCKCTCAEAALTSITGEVFERDVKKWKEWWESRKAK